MMVKWFQNIDGNKCGEYTTIYAQNTEPDNNY